MSEQPKQDYKVTLNLPKTDFPMKANLPQREPETLKRWQDMNIYDQIRKKTSGKPKFILHDGPPYANGNIHVGTAMNKILKDIIVRYKTMSGFDSPFVPGWDCHGQPIEHNVEKQLGERAKTISQVEFRKLCRDYALDFVNKQREQFMRLGVVGDWFNPYLTLEHEYEATNVKVFGELYKRGLVYKRRKPIHWCIEDQTALAEAEIEYREETSPSIYVKFPLKSEFEPIKDFNEPKFVVIWTTTPWTLPANVAIAVHPDAWYVAVRAAGQILILAEARLEEVAKEIGISEYEIVARFKGSNMEFLICEHPLFAEKESIVVLADYVGLDTGTGAVHTAPGHGQEDYMTGLKYDLPAPMPVDATGRFTKEAGQFAGMYIIDANKAIIDYLKGKDLLPFSTEITHAYPCCWRCKNPVIFRATEQWFISMDINNLRGAALDSIGKVNWIPDWSVRRIVGMVEARPDWCISRQRSWGVPIPVFYCADCQDEVVTDETIGAVIELFKEKGADAWFAMSAEEILPNGFTCPKCGGKTFEKETDILDVWFESGVSNEAVLKTRPELSWPADLYTEGSDQHRGWFQSSLMTSVGVHDMAPYKSVLTHGFVVDGEGRKMSKSLGNVVDPLDVISKSGADILRLWVASSDYTVDVAISPDILKHVGEAYRRIRNTFRFILGNLYDFRPGVDSVDYDQLQELDKWALHEATGLLKNITEAYNDYRFHAVYHSVYSFFTNELSSLYLDILKDRLYASAADSVDRRAAQTVLFEILVTFVKALAPILAFTCEEVWSNLPEEVRDVESVHLSDWPVANEKYLNPKLDADWNKILKVRAEVAKALEIARNEKKIGNSLEAQVELYVSEQLQEFLGKYGDMLAQVMIVSSVKIYPYFEAPESAYKSELLQNLAIKVSPAPGAKCERCWRFEETVGGVPEHPGLCARCAAVLETRV
ncbi:MAG: isoleucine--tRNA ligase [Actinomycetota bacterium]|nr:isoleucine--tRNA ligase [Actinomycetota bacterium]